MPRLRHDGHPQEQVSAAEADHTPATPLFHEDARIAPSGGLLPALISVSRTPGSLDCRGKADPEG